MITPDQSRCVFRLLKFPATTAPEAHGTRVQGILDRLQVLALEQPHTAEALLDWNERFLTKVGIPATNGGAR